MKIYNKKILSIVTTGFILISLTGCSNNLSKTLEKETVIVENNENNNSLSTETVNNKTNKQEKFNNENEVVEYFNNIENEITNLLNNDTTQNVKDKVTNFFVTTIDFIFYDKEIKGITFDSLTNETKLKILKIASTMDTKIENKFPNYKDKIKATSSKVYDSASTKIKEGINYLDEKAYEKLGEENYNNMKDGYEDMKKSFKNTGEIIKDEANKAKEKVKSWYEEKTNK